MKTKTYALLLLAACWAFSGMAQSDIQKEITASVNDHQVARTDSLLFRMKTEVLGKAGSNASDSAFWFFSMAKLQYEKQQRLKQEEKLTVRYKNYTDYYDLLLSAFAFSRQGAVCYVGLPADEQASLRRAITATDDELRQQLSLTIEQEAYNLLKGAQYRKPTRQLYEARIYHKTIDADTLVSLREALFDQCSRFLSAFEGSNYQASVKGFRKELLSEYINLETVRQFGEKGGEKYENYCASILELFDAKELAHLLPQFYGAEYGWGKSGWQAHPNFLKLKELAKANQMSELDLLCRLSIHSEGCHDGNRALYDQFIKKMAPADVALVAVQKVLSPFVYTERMAEAKQVIDAYRAYFPAQSVYFDQLETLLSTEDDRKLVNLGSSINTRDQEFYPVLSLDEKNLYFARKTVEYGEDIFISYQFDDKDWLPSEPISSNLNTASHELPLGISADGNTLLLYGNYSILPNYGHIRNQEKRLGKGDFYFTQRVGKGWGKIEVFPYPVNTPNYEAGISLSANGKALFFASDREGAVGGYNPIYHPDYLYYHGGGEFNLDIYVSLQDENGKWGEPQNLGEVINTPYAEKNPFIHPDGQTLYFSSNGHYGLGGYDIFMCKRKNPDSWTEWTVPVNVGRAINSPYDDSFYMSATGRKALLVSNREGDNFGKTDIYWVNVPKKYRPEPIIIVTGQIVDDKGKPVFTDIFWETEGEPKEFGKLQTHPDDGKFMFAVKPGKRFTYYPQKDKLFSSSIVLDLLKQKESEILPPQKVIMTSVDITDTERKPFVLKTLRFDFDEDVIKPESFFDLDRLVNLLLQNPSFRLSIEGHTDNKGSHDFNMDLSERRTASVRNYLIKKGISASRLTNQGFGETKPIAPNTTDEGRQLNRRVEFKITTP